MTQSEIAREVGVSRPLVSKVLTKSVSTQKRLTKVNLPSIRLTKDPALAAANIREKMGEGLGGESETAAHKIPSGVASTAA